VHRPLVRSLAIAAALVVAAAALSGCAAKPEATSVSDCGGILSKVLLTDDSATAVADFNAGGIPKIFDIPSTPAPTCYYVSTTPPSGTVPYTQTTRTLLYIGISESDARALIASLRKTVSEKPWTVRYDYGAPTASPTPTPGASASAAPVKNPSSSARWYYNFAGAASEDKGEMGYYYTAPISQGTADQAGLSKPVDVLRIETQLRQVKN
jgi:hypothetical protein